MDAHGWLEQIYPQLRALFSESWLDNNHLVLGNGTNGMEVGQACFYKVDGWDAEENSISGSGCRPLSNACIMGEAMGLAQMGALVNGSAAEAAYWANLTSIFRTALTDVLWNEQLSTFSTLALPVPGCNNTPGSHKPCNMRGPAPSLQQQQLVCSSALWNASACDAMARGGPLATWHCGRPWWPENKLTQVREMHALSTPWMLGLFADDPKAATYAKAWRCDPPLPPHPLHPTPTLTTQTLL